MKTMVSGVFLSTQVSRLAQQALSAVILFPAVYSLTLMWWIPEGDKYVPGMVFLALIAFAITKIKSNKANDVVSADIYRVRLCLGLFAVYSAALYLWHGDSWTELRALLSMAIYFAIFRELNLSRMYLKILLSVSALGFIILSWTLYSSGTPRIGGFINPIPYATSLAAILMMTFVLGVLEKGGIQKLIFFLLSAGLLTALFMTQTRGVLLPVLFLIPLFVLIRATVLKKFGAAVMVLMAFAGALSGLALMISSDRINQTFKEIESIEQGDRSGSIGLRLQMWEASIDLWLQRPFFGSGETHKERLIGLSNKRVVSKRLVEFSPSHYHNQYLDLLVKKGFVGLGLFSIFLISVFLLTVRSKHSFMAWGGSAVVLVYALAGLSDVPFRHPASVYLFVSLICFYFAPLEKYSQGIE